MGFIGKLFGGSKPPVDDTYLRLRTQALSAATTDLSLAHDPRAPIHAVIMETGLEDAVATFVCARDGAASLYLSRGGGVIGGGQHENVRAACLEMFSITNRYAQDFISACQPVTTYPFPRKGQVFFYLVTDDAVYQGKGPEQALAAQQHPFSALFNNCHAVMSEVRALKEKL